MGLVMCAVDGSEDGLKVHEAARATGEDVLLVHVANSMLESAVPAFIEDGGETERKVEHGPTGDGLLRAADRHGAELIVIGTRARLWPSVARYVTKRAACPVLVVGPRAEPDAEPVTAKDFDRRLVKRSKAPVLISD